MTLGIRGTGHSRAGGNPEEKERKKREDVGKGKSQLCMIIGCCKVQKVIVYAYSPRSSYQR
jgi:hypothetical protein